MRELKEFLLARDYPERLIDSALDKARAVPRHKALMKGIKRRQQKNAGPVFALKYNPRLPSISNIQAKHWRSMSNDPYMKEVFPQPPITAYRRQKNLRDFIIRAKVSQPKNLGDIPEVCQNVVKHAQPVHRYKNKKISELKKTAIGK